MTRPQSSRRQSFSRLLVQAGSLFAGERPPSRKPRRRLALESLEGRRVLAVAVDLASIQGTITNNGANVSGANVQLYRDNGDGVFNLATDSSESTATTNSSGLYQFPRVTAGSYFVLQPPQTVGGRSLPQQVSPLIPINATSVQGQIIDTIDGFNTASQTVSDTTNDGVPVVSSVAAPQVIGGERDLFVNKTSATGSIQLSVNDALLPDLLSFDSAQLGDGQRRISWDGPDGTALTIDDTGLGGLDLTQSGAAAGVRLQVGADRAGGTAIIRIYSSDGVPGTATRFSTASLNIPDTGGTPSSAEFLPFTSFVDGGGGAAALTSVGAIELEISGSANVNGTVELVGTIGPTTFTQDFANTESTDLSLTKTVSNSTPSTGQNVTFTITVTNAGPSGATSVQVRDSLPPGLGFVSSVATQGSYDDATGTWNVGSIANAANATLTIVASVNAASTITNTAEVSQVDQADPDSTPGNNVAGEDDQASVVISPQIVDISLAKTIDNSIPNLGQNVTFVVTATNAGPNTATGVVVRDLLPTGMTLVTATASQGSYNTTTGLWTVGSIAAGASPLPSLTIVATVNSTGPRTNTAEVFAIDQTDVDSVPNNNVASEDDQASVTFDTPISDLSLTKTTSNARPNIGEAFSFTITLANAGPANASGVTVSDLLPAGVTFVSSTVSEGSYDAASGIWNVGNVPVGATPTLTINAQLNRAGLSTNTAFITSSDQFDPDSTPGNNVATEDDQQTVSVSPRTIDLSLSKSVDVTRPNVGQNVVFTIIAVNAGPDLATGVVVSDQLPVGLSFVSASALTGSYDPLTGLWTIGDVAVGATPSLEITAQFTAGANVTNVAQVNAANEFDSDSTPGNSAAIEDDQASATITPALADLSLTKTASNLAPNVGDTVTFTITATNAGPDLATGVNVRDLIPPETTLISATANLGTYDQTTGIWNIGNVSTAVPAVLTIQVRTQSTNLVTNTAEIIASDQLDPDSTPNNNVASEDDQATATLQAQQIDLSLTKTIDNARPNLDDQVTFVLTVANSGPSQATGVVVTDVLPPGLVLVSSTPSQGSFNTTTGEWSVGSLAPNGSATLSLVARVTTLGERINTAQVTAANQVDVDSTPNNNVATEDDQASVVLTVPVADLSVTKTVNNERPNLDEIVTFRVTINNAGPDTATGVRVTDVLPSGMAFVSTSLSAGGYDAATGIWNIGSLSATSTETLDILARVETQGAKTNTARVTAANEADPDSTAGNNVPGEDDQDQVTITPQQVDLSLTKASSVTRPSLGEDVDFIITLTNAGPDNATGVTVTDLLPPGLSFVASTATVGTYDPISGVWSVGSLASLGNATLTITARVESAGVKTNVAEVTTADQFDIDSTPGNNVATEDDFASVAVTPASADLSLEKTVSTSTPNVGSQVTFTLTVRNAGPDAASNVVVADPLPSGLSLVSFDPSVGSFDPSTGTWTIATIAVGANATLELVATVDTLNDKTNIAEITSSSQLDPDSTPGNFASDEDDIASVTLSPQLVDLALAKSIDDPVPNVGDTVEYTLTLSNAGPSTATGVIVTDQLSSGTTFVSSTPSQGTYNATTGVWTVGTVPPGATPTLLIRAIVLNVRRGTNTAEISAADQTDIDSIPGNASVTEDDYAEVEFVTQTADLSLTKSVDNSSPDRGENVTFTINLTNSGPNAATNVDVRDRLPAGLQFVSASPSVGTYDSTSGLWTIASINNGDQATLVIVALVTSGAAATNRAEVVARRQFDPDSTPGNMVDGEDDMASVTLTPNVVDISVSASVDNNAPLVGDSVAITINTCNAGPSDATGVVVSAPIPEGLSLVSAVPSQGTYDPATGTWTVGPIAAGADTQLVLNTVVDVRGIKQLPIEVVAVDQFDIDSTPNNNVATEDDQTTLVIQAPRLLSKRLFLSR